MTANAPLLMKARIHSARLLAVVLAGIGFGWTGTTLTHAVGTNRIFATQYRTTGIDLFLNLRFDSSVVTSTNLAGAAGGVYSLDFLGDTLYGAEYVDSLNYYLVTIQHEGALVGQSTRVSANPIGFKLVEGLAVANGVIYAASFDDAPPHVTRLITINPATGIGTLVGTMAPDIIVVGLAFDPVNQVMYGAGIAYAGTPRRLYRIDTQKGEATLIGPLTAQVQGLSWDVDLGLIGAFANLFQINPQTGTATQIGTNIFTPNGLWGLAGYVPTSANAPVLRLLSVGNGNAILNWNSISNTTYVVESRGSLSSGTWTNLSPNLLAPGSNTTYTNIGGGSALQRYFRLRTVAAP